MKTEIRKARLEDAEAFIAIKRQLPMKPSDGTTTKGGFLLGTDVETYRRFIQNDYCLVAEGAEGVIGFGIIVTNDHVRQSDIWMRRKQAKWTIDIDAYEDRKVCYFEQLAFLHGHGREVLKLCYNLVAWAFDDGHEHLFTATVKEPILNLAAVPYILKGSGGWVGNIDESYPGIGKLNSDIYMIDAARFYSEVPQQTIYPYLRSHYIRFSQS